MKFAKNGQIWLTPDCPFFLLVAEVYTHNTDLKKRLLAYAEKYPQHCIQTDDNGHGGLRFEIDKRRLSIRLTSPPSPERREAASQWAKENGFGAKKP